MSPKAVGIKDVAAAAGVSVASVSLALRGKGRISAPTRARIQEAADRLGYRPHAAARSLAGDGTHVLAISMPEIVDVPVLAGEVQHFLGILGGAAGAALEGGHLLTVAPSDPASPAWRRVSFDGAVVADPAVGDGVVPLVRSRGTPLVTIGRDPAGGASDLQVDNDVPAATRDVLDLLRERGARRIAVGVVAPLMSVELDTQAAYRAWCRAQGQPGALTVAGSPADEDVADAAREILGATPPPDAVYCTLDLLAEAVLERAAALGLRVPDDLQVMTLSDSQIARRLGLSTVDERPAQLGAEAIELLVAHLAGDEDAGARRRVDVDLVLRATTRG
ncbi:LacI family DNA-binding transcriptional regulator [Patulibacter sp. SYSU D01012]|uniref:LacI family DNA-binding transcriptional regulator n=1 Tax=Patulibacter sp. SYSU D01012 TaxID=2817381 RepID=UPI001B311F9D